MGKEGEEFMEGAVYSHLGSDSGKVIVGPGRGLDNGVVRIGGGRVLIVTVDPVSVVPGFGGELSAWLSVHLIASDFTASGSDPKYATFSYNFPPAMALSERRAFVASVGDACRGLGVAIVAGHTGSYPGGGYTVIGAGTMLGEAPDGKFVTAAMAMEGDAIVMTKQAAIEAAGSLGMSFPGFVRKETGIEARDVARGLLSSCSTVLDARSARRAGLGPGRVTSMHDATEGGVLGALEEMAVASGKLFSVDADRVRVSPEVEALCGAFKLDPLETMGEGALLITCAPDLVDGLLGNLRRDRLEAAVIGSVKKGSGLTVKRKGGRPRRFVKSPDRYWAAYDRATALGLK